MYRISHRKFYTVLAVIFVLPAVLLSGCVPSRPAAAPSPTPLPQQPVVTAAPHQLDFAHEARPNTEGRAPSNLRPHLNFRQISREQGLSQSVIYAILQDRYGFIWIGTQDGLNRYDGYNFTVFEYNPENPNSLSNNTVLSLYEDRAGTLWIGTESGLNRYDRDLGQFTRFHHDPLKPDSLSHDAVRTLFEDSAGRFWVGTLGGGLNLMDRSTGRFSYYRNNPNDPTSLSSHIVWDVFEDSGGNLWVGTWNGLERFDPATGIFHHYRNNPKNPDTLSGNLVWSIQEDRQKRLWIGTEGGLDLLDRQKSTFTHFKHDPDDDPFSLSDNTVSDILIDADGKLWTCTNTGVNQLVPSTGTFVRHDEEYRSTGASGYNPCLQIYQDRSGAYWVGTQGSGLLVFDRRGEQFNHFNRQPRIASSLSNNMIWAIYQDHEGTLWIGTDNGLNRYDAGADGFVHYFHDPSRIESLSSSAVRAIFEDNAGVLWVGTAKGLNRYNNYYNLVSPYRFSITLSDDKEIDLANEPVTALNQDTLGNLWIGIEGMGLVRLNQKTRKAIVYGYDEKNPNSLSGSTVYAIYVDRRGEIWAGTRSGGLNRFNPESGDFTHYHSDPDNPNTLSYNTVLSIFEDSDGRLWVGTTNGLNRFDRQTGVFKRYYERDGLPNEVIYGILADDKGGLWLSTNGGISHFDPSTGLFKNYSQRDGLQSDEFNNGAYFKNSNGELFFGGINGFNAFAPSTIQENPYHPPVVLTQITQGGEPISTGSSLETAREITLSWPKNYFEFEFAALSYIQPDKNQYRYRLDNFDHQWNEVGAQRYGKYTNLSGGTYTLQILGANNDGLWNAEGAAIRVRVIPPFWENLFFRWAVLMALATLLWTSYRLRISSIRRHNTQLATQVAERTQEIERRRQVAEGLREVLARLNSNQPLGESLNYIVCQVLRLSGANRVCIIEQKDGRGEILAHLTTDQAREINENRADLATVSPEMPAEVSAWLLGQTESTAIRVLKDDHTNFRKLFPTFENIRTIVTLPILPEREFFGVLVVMFTSDQHIGSEQLDILRAFGDQAALAIGNASLRARAEEMAVISERSRLSRDLHDAVTQTLFSASLIAEALPTLWENDQREGRDLLRELRQLNRGALAEMRALLMELRPSALSDARLSDLLQQLAEAAAGRTGITIHMNLHDGAALPRDVHVGLYRIAQETLNNVVKHAHACDVWLRLDCAPVQPEVDGDEQDWRVALEICDNGCGFDINMVPLDHFGLANMQDRAEAIGARLDITSQPGSGTQVKVFWEGKAQEHG